MLNRSRRAWTRRRTRSLAAVATVAGVIVAVIAAPWADRGPSVAERAYAAVSEPKLFHVVVRTTVDAPPTLSDWLRLPAKNMVTEAWHDQRDRALREVLYAIRDGRRFVLMDWAVRGKRLTVSDKGQGKSFKKVWNLGDGPVKIPSMVPRRFDPLAEFKQALRADKVQDDGEVVAAGRRAHRLVVEHDPYAEGRFKLISSKSILLFDAQTMYPIEFVNRGEFELDGRPGSARMRSRYTTFEALPRTPENLAKLRMP